MSSRHPLLIRALLVGAVVSLIASACANSGAAPSGSDAPSGTASSAAVGSAPPSATGHLDQAFIDMMVPHHQSAVEMAELASDRAEHRELRALAQDIIAAQEPEIAQLREWRQAWFGSAETPPMDAMPLMPGMATPGMEGHSMNGTMDMTADIDALETADPFDLAFIDAMVAHHEQAVAAAEIIRTSSQRQELIGLADVIIEAQQREIEQLLAWRETWYGT